MRPIGHTPTASNELETKETVTGAKNENGQCPDSCGRGILERETRIVKMTVGRISLGAKTESVA
jgi:hypothetical protein